MKALALAGLGAAENATIVLFVFGPAQHWGWLLLGTVLLAFLYALAGIAVVARYSALNAFLIPSVAWIAAFSLPLLGFYDLVPRWLFVWHPLTPSLLLLEASGRTVPVIVLAYGIVAGVGWCTAAFLWARFRLVQVVAPAAA